MARRTKKYSNYRMIYFTSDTHFHHKNIVRGTTSWTDKSQCRPFDSLEDHDNWLVNSINSIVQFDDLLIHAGDWSFGGEEQIMEFRNQLHCNHIILICGNHDHHITKNPSKYLDNENGRIFTEIIPHLSSFQFKTNSGQDMIIQHYAQRTWFRANKGSWMLYGHSHGSLDDGFPGWRYKTMDIGVDNLMKRIGRPVISFTELNDLFKERSFLNTDHHNETTNDK